MYKKFTLRYLPLFEQDMAAVCGYIALNLNNPAAAVKLVADVKKAIVRRLETPRAFEEYHSTRDRRQPYYRINVRNYSVFYVVTGNVMEVRRFLYSKRDLSSLI